MVTKIIKKKVNHSQNCEIRKRPMKDLKVKLHSPWYEIDVDWFDDIIVFKFGIQWNLP